MLSNEQLERYSRHIILKEVGALTKTDYSFNTGRR